MLPRLMFKSLFFPVINILIGAVLLTGFFMAGQNITQTFTVADMAALNNLRPEPINYFWELNFNHASLDKNKIRYYADYYEHLLEHFPSLWDAYGLLGYCYENLDENAKAIKFLKIAIRLEPDYFWNYYNLALIDINESRYQEAIDLLQKALNVSPMGSFKRIITSGWVYLPLLGSNEKEIVTRSAEHLKEVYQSSYLLEQVLRHCEKNQIARDMIKKLHPEPYAF